MRQWPAVPVASALVSCQVPSLALLPPDAAAIQSEARVRVASTVPALACEQSDGGAPVRMVRIGLVPTVVSIWSNWAFLRLTLYCRAMRNSFRAFYRHPIAVQTTKKGTFRQVHLI